MNILIVDDSAPMRRMIQRVVASLAHKVFECSDGPAALAAYRTHRPDLVVMDVRLGEMDGITATQKICASDPHARVVIVTDYDDAALRAAASEAGACTYVLKDELYRLPSVLRAVSEGS